MKSKLLKSEVPRNPVSALHAGWGRPNRQFRLFETAAWLIQTQKMDFLQEQMNLQAYQTKDLQILAQMQQIQYQAEMQKLQYELMQNQQTSISPYLRGYSGNE